ncbi:hypothetical protein [Arthrobacter sp. 35W]|uniref:hypothetical protein n=1 Tax=Arthrobacter sp. 35W TaxID=1132441 RepID=UPI00047DF8C2|nr:hypothetical protein [Arthrobacter sp. 35W]
MDNGGGPRRIGYLLVRAAVPLAAVALVVFGVGMALIGQQQASFGWFAYAPLSDQTFSSDGLLFLSGETQIGVVVAVIGLLMLAFWSGFRTGRRR